MLYRNLLLISLVLFRTLMPISPKTVPGFPDTKKWLISENSNLSVKGSTNINTFACDIPAYDQTDTLTITKGKGDKGIVLSGVVGLKVHGFDCHNSMMTKDLRKTLKEKEYPQLQVRFLSLSDFPELKPQPTPITGMVNIEIAGTGKRFEVSYQVSVDAQKVVHLVGSRDVCFSDFNLVPPRKLGGMIRTNDKLNVVFHLRMTAMN